MLGYDLGRTGVDGVFLGQTREAVIAFQHEHGLSEDGIVGPETWAALVDATFVLGDRMLYLRLPYFHGNDVRVLQGALNSLGFSCGPVDGIFGSFTERAVREFQRNIGQRHDGIVGPETVRAIENLRHVWEGKQTAMPESATLAPARLSQVLTAHSVAFFPRDELTEDVAIRAVNLALATDSGARVLLTSDPACAHADVVIELCSADPEDATGGPVVSLGEGKTADLARRLAVALQAASEGPCTPIRVVMDTAGSGERDHQRAAVRLLDAVCLALA